MMRQRAVYTSFLAMSVFGAAHANAQVTAPSSIDADVPKDIIVTGTRRVGITAAESATPIKLVGQDAISHVGQPNLNQVLTQLVPSFHATAFGEDAANLTLSTALRGLNPNHTLVLVNGKRRHGTANFDVRPSPTQGAAAPDLDFIPATSIDHIEVLEDGAAAQYGSDAVAGVINIIQKKSAGGSLSATGGKNYARGGLTYSGSLNYGWRTDRGYLNFTAFYRNNHRTREGDQDLRAQWIDGSPSPGLSGTLLSDIEGADNFPDVTPAYGRAKSQFGAATFNTGYDLTDHIQFYSFGSIGYRNASFFGYYRTPNGIVATADGTNSGGVSNDDYNSIVMTDPSRIFARNGFVPILAFRERDNAITGGLRGDLLGWRWDLSTTYGDDRIDAYTRNSVNADLFAEQGSRKRNFYDGAFVASEWTSNLDISRDFGGFATLAFGGEYRENQFDIRAGEPASYYKTGAQAYPGFGPGAAGDHQRHNYAIYGDIALTPVTGLKLDAAVRHEKYSDFGNTTNWKLNGRYDFSPAIAIRGTVSTGFRAPTLAEQYYTQVSVGPTLAIVQLAPNSAAAKILGVDDLKAEKSRSFSAGLVLHPLRNLTATIDAYQIRLRNRIVGTATIFTKSAGFDPDDLIWRSIAATGFGVNSSTALVGVTSFVNGTTTRTRGVDLTTSYAANFEAMGRANFTLSGAYIDTKVQKNASTPAPLVAYGATIADGQSDSFLTTVTPKFKIIGGVNWSLGKLEVTARETYYSRTSATFNNGFLNKTYIRGGVITDLEVGYNLSRALKLSVGAQNLFDKRPNTNALVAGGLSDGGAVVNRPLPYGPYGIDGGYYYGRIDMKF